MVYYWKDMECIALLVQTLPLHLDSSLGMPSYLANPPKVLISLTLLHSSTQCFQAVVLYVVCLSFSLPLSLLETKGYYT